MADTKESKTDFFLLLGKYSVESCAIEWAFWQLSLFLHDPIATNCLQILIFFWTGDEF